MAQVKPQTEGEEQARALKRDWQARALSPARDFFVASHPGWDDAAQWEAQARRDADLYLFGIDRRSLADAQLLEIGCGVGRLARQLAPLCAGYTGIDIAPAMVAEARRRCADLGYARFLESGGTDLPDAARDRRYRLAIAAAVFIHCPRPVIAALVRAAFDALEPGGQLRFQLLADPDDLEGIGVLPPAIAAAAAASAATASPASSAIPPQRDVAAAEFASEARRIESAAPPESLALIEGHAYMGARFRYAEAGPFLAAASGGHVELVRLSAAHLCGWIERR